MLQKIENYKRALTQLEEAVKRYRQSPEDTLYRDGLIQRFEFTVELAWKSMKEYLEDQGMVLSIASPRGILKEAYAAGALEDGDQWNKILTARNLTSHVYDEATASNIAQQICAEFLGPLQALMHLYEGEQTDPFDSAANQAHLRQAIAGLDAGDGSPHELSGTEHK